jgi:hypothetical protein
MIAAAAAALFGIAMPAAHALPVNGSCKVITYYADATMQTKVGSQSNCPGAHGLTGRKTAFFEVDDIPIGPGPRPKPPTPGKLPCEFLQDCSVNLPIAR